MEQWAAVKKAISRCNRATYSCPGSLIRNDLLFMEPWAAAKNASRSQQLLSEFYLPRVSRQSRLSANNKGDIEMIPETVHRYPGIYLTGE